MSLLARLELRGVDVGGRWQDLGAHLASRADDTLQPFLTMQYLYGLARAGRPEAETAPREPCASVRFPLRHSAATCGARWRFRPARVCMRMRAVTTTGHGGALARRCRVSSRRREATRSAICSNRYSRMPAKSGLHEAAEARGRRTGRGVRIGGGPIVGGGPGVGRGRCGIGMQLEPPILDPTSSPAAAITEIEYGNVFEGLVQFAADGSPRPALAESPGRSPPTACPTPFICAPTCAFTTARRSTRQPRNSRSIGRWRRIRSIRKNRASTPFARCWRRIGSPCA